MKFLSTLVLFGLVSQGAVAEVIPAAVTYEVNLNCVHTASGMKLQYRYGGNGTLGSVAMFNRDGQPLVPRWGDGQSRFGTDADMPHVSSQRGFYSIGLARTGWPRGMFFGGIYYNQSDLNKIAIVILDPTKNADQDPPLVYACTRAPRN